MTPTIKNDAHTAAMNGSGLKDPVALASKRVPQLAHSSADGVTDGFAGIANLICDIISKVAGATGSKSTNT
jgi:hypothetical protein